MSRRLPHAARFLIPLALAAAVPLLLWLALPMLSGAASQDELQGRIDSQRSRESSLSDQISELSQHINTLAHSISVLEQRQAEVQADLDDNLAELDRIQTDLRTQRS